MFGESSDGVDEMERAHTANESIWKATARSQQNKLELCEQCHIVSIETFNFRYKQY